ncbi:hypothetical protein EVA_15642 [gut metagenome]|uniref:Uncharacterized protein n=1 Tax=gut metagenome TaxID=749906 RepID=J9FMU7_9ZZZZ
MLQKSQSRPVKGATVLSAFTGKNMWQPAVRTAATVAKVAT